MEVALGLGLTDTGFDFSVLSEFRTRVAGHWLEARALDLLVAALVDKGLIRAGQGAYGFHACVGRGPRPQPSGVGRGVRAAALEAIGGGGAVAGRSPGRDQEHERSQASEP